LIKEEMEVAKSTIKAPMLAKMFLAGAKNLEAKKEWINELNVFPVPDGDTGTNMTMTIMAAAAEVQKLGEELDMASLAKAISSGSLRGARGNSGVILSQLFRGFTKGISKYELLDAVILSDAFQKAVETAYKAVMKPKEGTILTVAKGAADKALELIGETDDLEVFLAQVIQHAEYVLSQTPEMLPVLKQAGVVDSGGQGLVTVLQGAYDALVGKVADYTLEGVQASGGVTRISQQAEQDIKFGYCTEFIVVLDRPLGEKGEIDFKAYLESVGDSIVVVADEEITKVHVHTNDPGLVIQRALTYGSLSKIKIDNMREEHQEKLIKDAQKAAKEQKQADEKRRQERVALEEEAHRAPKKEMGFISVSIGEGINEIFQGLGVDYIIAGGQTMNPSTEDMLNAIEEVNADNIFILPNNKNIILAANQAASLMEEKNIYVVPTKTVPQGITALINYMPDSTPEENAARMAEELSSVKTGQVTYAVRDTLIDDKEIKQGDYMGMGDSSILSVGGDMEQVTKDMVGQLVDGDSAIISIYYGQDVEEGTAQKLGEEIGETYPGCEVEVHYGGQPIYYYLISVE
jgi:DAK2 domain fusion protein YloV